MADFLTSPQITGPGVNMAEALYKMISGLPDQYQQGAEAAFKRRQNIRTEELQKPIDADLNTPEGIQSGLRELMRRGGGEYFEKMVPYLTGVQADRSLAQGPPEGGGAPATDHQTPEKLRGEQPPSAASVGAASQPGQADDTAGPYTLKALVQRSGFTDNPVRTANMLGAQMGINPNTMLTREQAGQVSAALENKFGEGGPGTDVREAPDFTGKATNVTPLAPPAAAPIVPNRVKTVQAPPYQTITPQQAPPAAQTPVGTEAQAIQYENRAAARSKWLQANARNASPGAVKEAEAAIAADRARAKDIRDTLAKYAEPTKEQKNAPPGMSPQESAAYAEALKGQAAASAKNIATRIEGIKPAQEGIQVLDEMTDALRHGGTNISTGPGAKQWLKAKQAVNNMVPGFFKGVPESEEVEKLNAYLAAAVAKSMTARPTQYEFKAFQEQNPGLSTSREGSMVLADILHQTKVQELELGRKADKFQFGRGKTWSEVEEEYFKQHPIISPLTHKPISAKQAPDGNWYMPDPDRRGKYLQVR